MFELDVFSMLPCLVVGHRAVSCLPAARSDEWVSCKRASTGQYLAPGKSTEPLINAEYRPGAINRT